MEGPTNSMTTTPRNDEIINNNDTCIFRINETRYFITKVSKTMRTRISKNHKNVSLAPVVGHPWGSFFEIVDGNLVRTDSNFNEKLLEKVTVSGSLDEDVGTRDNRNVKNNDNSVQELTQEKIEELKKVETGDNIISAIVANSQTFQQRTEMGKQKYLKKKMQKYLVVIEVIKPTSLMLAKTYFSKSADKICFMRLDSLGVILSKANIHAMGKSVLIVDETGGLVTGAVAERMGGNGVIVNTFPVTSNLNVIQFFGFTQKQSGIINSVSFEALHKLESGQPLVTITFEEGTPVPQSVQKRLNMENTLKPIVADGFDSLIIIKKENDTPAILKLLFPFLKSGSPFCIFSPYMQPLILCHELIKQSDSAIAIDLSEQWLREYQVAPNRTHPINQMSGASGYVLSGTKLSGSKLGAGCLEQFVTTAGSKKKFKAETPVTPPTTPSPTTTTETTMDFETSKQNETI